MAEQAKGAAGKDHGQVTLIFKPDDPVDRAMFQWVQRAASGWKITPAALIKSAIDAGRVEAEARAKARYEKLRDFDAGLVSGFRSDLQEAAGNAADAAKAEPAKAQPAQGQPAQGRSGLPT